MLSVAFIESATRRRETGKSKAYFINPAIALAVAFLTALSLYSLFKGLTANVFQLRESLIAFSFEGVVLSLALIFKTHYSGIRLFEPFTMVTVVYTLTFFVAPVLEFGVGNTSRFGVDVSGNALLATITATLGYIAFYAGYELYHPMMKRIPKTSVETVSPERAVLVKQIALFIWLLCYVLCLYNYLKRGYSLSYIVTAGFGGESDAEIAEDSLAFLSYAKYALVGSWMCLFPFSKNRLILVTTYVLTVSMLLFGGSRSSLLMILIAPIAFQCIRIGREPSLRSVLIAAVVLVFAFAVIQVARNGVKLGNGFSLEGYELADMFTPYLNEIEGFKVYYSLFDVFPVKKSFLLGTQMVGYTLIMLVPRSIWPGKPDAPIHDIVYQAMGLQALQSGNSYPFIGELFVEFGVPGCILGMLLFGALCKKIGTLWSSWHGNTFPLVEYCLFYPALFQFMIRGYFPSNCMMFMFLLAPVLLVKFLSKKGASRHTVIATGGGARH